MQEVSHSWTGNECLTNASVCARGNWYRTWDKGQNWWVKGDDVPNRCSKLILLWIDLYKCAFKPDNTQRKHAGLLGLSVWARYFVYFLVCITTVPYFCTQLVGMPSFHGVISRNGPFRRCYVITHKIRKKEEKGRKRQKEKEKEKAEKAEKGKSYCSYLES